MSHRSNIAIKEKNGKIRAVYCHNGGLLDSNGVILHEHYSDQKKVKSLIDLGDLSSVGKYVSPDKDIEKEEGEHSFDNRHSGVTVAYGRDRGEEDTEPFTFEDEDEFIKESAFDIEKIYLFKDGEWYVCDKFEGDEKFMPLAVKLEQVGVELK